MLADALLFCGKFYDNPHQKFNFFFFSFFFKAFFLFLHSYRFFFQLFFSFHNPPGFSAFILDQFASDFLSFPFYFHRNHLFFFNSIVSIQKLFFFLVFIFRYSIRFLFPLIFLTSFLTFSKFVSEFRIEF